VTARRLLRLLVGAVVTPLALVGILRLSLPAVAGPGGEPPGVRQQLAYLRSALDSGGGERAQRDFPEGYFFLHMLYGLAWVELGLRRPPADRGPALHEARWALSRVDSSAGRAPFAADLTPAYGVFYRGWTNWLRGGVVSLRPPGQRDPAEVAAFVADSVALGAAFDAAATPFLAAYPGQAWPVDSTVAVASLRLHDHLLPARFTATVGRWLAAARERLDPATGLLPHRAEVRTGRPLEGARGTSQSVIARFLVDIDPAFARDQYLRFRAAFVRSPLGLGPAVREYPDGSVGEGDVDSGPLVLGVSVSATVVTLGAAQVQADRRLAGALANYGELAGAPVMTPWTKRYAFGLLPIGDAFLAWAKTARPWVAPVPDPPPPSVSLWWRLPLLILLVAIGSIPWLPRIETRGILTRRLRGAGMKVSAPARDHGGARPNGTHENYSHHREARPWDPPLDGDGPR
jgi:hypothetical protein